MKTTWDFYHNTEQTFLGLAMELGEVRKLSLLILLLFALYTQIAEVFHCSALWLLLKNLMSVSYAAIVCRPFCANCCTFNCIHFFPSEQQKLKSFCI